ncbi:MAG: M56 family metallopeptidase, partial [Luteimonas sp.]
MDRLWNAQFGFAPALALALLHSLWQGALLAAMAGVALRLLARHGAALRHAVGMAFLLAMVAVPAVTLSRFWSQPSTEVNAGILPAMTAPATGATPGVFVQQSSGLAAALSLLWLLGVAMMLMRHLGGWRLIGALERHPFHPLPPEWQQRVDKLQRAMRITRTVAVRLADDVVAPFTARVLRPVIWLPMSLLSRLPTEQFEALLAHELAHIRRLDWLWNVLQCVAESLLFFHPCAWWLSRHIRQERENACDDLAVAACGDAIALAEALADLELHRYPVPRLLLAAQGGSLMKRITRLLS